MNTKPMSFHEAYAAILDPDAMLLAVDRAMWSFQVRHQGNAKTRRRWRRRNMPNTQRMSAIGVTLEDPSEAWEREDL